MSIEFAAPGRHEKPDASEPFMIMFTAWQEFSAKEMPFSHIWTARDFIQMAYVLSDQATHQFCLDGLKAAMSHNYIRPEDITNDQ